MLNYAAQMSQMQCFEASAPVADADGVILFAQVQCSEASAPFADADDDADGDVDADLLRRCSILKRRPLGWC